MSPRVEVAVVGCGMIGSAAARHLAEAGTTAALIGAGEPKDWQRPDAPFASHYDEARITRISAADPAWADLAASSIGRYGDIASRSAINFYEPRGLVQAAVDADAAIASALVRGGAARRVDAEWVHNTTTIVMPTSSGQELFYEDAPAGVLSPRRLVAAQTVLATQAGALRVEAVARSIRQSPGGFVVGTDRGDISASQILLATGAYGASLIGVDLAIERRLRTVVMVELEDITALPCLIVERPDQRAFQRLYWTPPVRYPDGRSLLKIGGSATALEVADSETDVAKWFAAGGSDAEATELLAALRDLLPTAVPTSVEQKPCVMTYTPTELPFVGFVDDNVLVALGGNGSAAKSSDELGRLAAAALAASTTRPPGPDMERFAPTVT